MIGNTLIYLPEVDSTNSFFKENEKNKSWYEGTVVYTFCQTSGRGQQGNTWQSEPNKNLTFSIYLTPRFLLAENQFFLSMTAALAVVDLLRLYQINAKIKWPNDIIVNRKKIAGILIENTLKNSRINTSIIGVGINVFQTKLEGLNATSIQLKNKEITQETVTLETMLQQYLSIFNNYYTLLCLKKYKELKQYYFNYLYGYQQPMMIERNAKRHQVLIHDVKTSGQVTLKFENDELHTFGFKEFKTIL